MEQIARPDHVPQERVFDCNVYECDSRDGDYQKYMLRLRAPGVPGLFWTDRNGGHWVATRGAYISQILNDTQRFSNRYARVPREANPQPPLLPAQVDAPKHIKYRKMIMGAFSPAEAKRLGVGARALAIGLIEDLMDRGECEFVGDFARRMPIAVFLAMVDLPEDEHAQLLEMSHRMVHPEKMSDRVDGWVWLSNYAIEKVRERRARPGNDFISELAARQEDGQLLDDDTLKGVLINLLLAGLDTVAAMLTFFVRHLGLHPDQRRALVNDLSLIPAATQELLRRHAVATLVRCAKEDFEFDGVEIRAGDLIALPTALKNLDEDLFDDPLKVDFDRQVRDIATFGGGPHNCPGSMLARVELQIFLEEWLARIPDWEIKSDVDLIVSVGTAAGIKALPITWDAAAVRGRRNPN